jgi:hypothetical protein
VVRGELMRDIQDDVRRFTPREELYQLDQLDKLDGAVHQAI